MDTSRRTSIYKSWFWDGMMGFSLGHMDGGLGIYLPGFKHTYLTNVH
jgi:hypothetical protein